MFMPAVQLANPGFKMLGAAAAISLWDNLIASRCKFYP